MANKSAAFLFHLSPLVPFAMGYVYAGIAVMLLVGLAYIKTAKLQATLSEYRQKRVADDAEVRSLEKAITFWRRLTFLPKQ